MSLDVNFIHLNLLIEECQHVHSLYVIKNAAFKIKCCDESSAVVIWQNETLNQFRPNFPINLNQQVFLDTDHWVKDAIAHAVEILRENNYKRKIIIWVPLAVRVYNQQEMQRLSSASFLINNNVILKVCLVDGNKVVEANTIRRLFPNEELPKIKWFIRHLVEIALPDSLVHQAHHYVS